MFLCGYCGSPNLQRKRDQIFACRFNPNKEPIYFVGDDDDIHITYGMKKPYVICNSCHQIQDDTYIGVWFNRMGMVLVKYEEL